MRGGTKCFFVISVRLASQLLCGLCVILPEGRAVNLKRTNSVWDSQVVTEEHQRDEGTVHDALTHVNINQQRSLNYRTGADLDSSHCVS